MVAKIIDGLAVARALRQECRARVEALHRALLAADETAGVTKLMMNVGIVNFGRYAQYYREQIGVSPSTTLKEKAQA